MNEWDAKDNTKPTKETGKTAHFLCQDCGVEAYCVSKEGMNEHGRDGQYVCNHCYDVIAGGNECSGNISDCVGCRYSLEQEGE